MSLDKRSPGDEPAYLQHVRQMAAIAQSGLTYCQNVYDIERFEQLQILAQEMLVAQAPLDALVLEHVLRTERGYATPKIDVRAAVFDEDRILMVRETADQGRWTLPGGWADVGQGPSASIIKEVREESGFTVKVDKLAAVWDRAVHPHAPNSLFHIWKHFYICSIQSGQAQTSNETSEVAFFPRHQIPQDLSFSRVLMAQIERMFVHRDSPELATDFD